MKLNQTEEPLPVNYKRSTLGYIEPNDKMLICGEWGSPPYEWIDKRRSQAEVAIPTFPIVQVCGCERCAKATLAEQLRRKQLKA
jgi:hypothetical protein